MPLRHIAADISHEIKVMVAVFNPNLPIANPLQSTLQKSPGQKPFWDSFDEIDVATYAEALVAVFRFLPEEESISLFLDCLEPERSDAVKICAIKAATTLSIEACTRNTAMSAFSDPLVGTSCSLAAIFGETPVRHLTALEMHLQGKYVPAILQLLVVLIALTCRLLLCGSANTTVLGLFVVQRLGPRPSASRPKR
jgi:hypothetical protein